MQKKSENYCTFYIVRHGQTEWNLNGLIQGHADSPLTLLGEEQARNVAKELQHVKFDIIFSSDLLRAKRTAEIINLERKLAVQTSKQLREKMYGKYEGKPYKAMKVFDRLYDALTEEERFKYKAGGVESDEETVTRLFRFIREMAIIYKNKIILVATHAEIMRLFLIHIGFGTYSNFPLGVIGNAAYFKLVTDGVDFFVKETKRINKPGLI